jgi:hypothetical protein
MLPSAWTVFPSLDLATGYYRQVSRAIYSLVRFLNATSGYVSIVPKPAESCRFENHGFAVYLGMFSSGISASSPSFFQKGQELSRLACSG